MKSKGKCRMDVHEFGQMNTRKIVLIPGNMMSWRQFEQVIPLLEKHFYVIAVSTDGYDGTGRTTFTTANAASEKLEMYIADNLDGEVDMVFGESFGSATALMLFHRQCVSVRSMILCGPQYMKGGIVGTLMRKIVPHSQYHMLKHIQSVHRLPLLMRLYTRGDDKKLLEQFKYAPANVSLETLKNCVNESLSLYSAVDGFEPRPNAKVAVWHGANEPNMRKALEKLRGAYPNMQVHSFDGYGHGEIMSHPDIMAAYIEEFMGYDE